MTARLHTYPAAENRPGAPVARIARLRARILGAAACAALAAGATGFGGGEGEGQHEAATPYVAAEGARAPTHEQAPSERPATASATTAAIASDQPKVAELPAAVALVEDLATDARDPGVSPANRAALDGSPTPRAGAHGAIPRTAAPAGEEPVVPRSVIAPLARGSCGGAQVEALKISISGPRFSYEGYLHLDSGRTLERAIDVPERIWNAALLRASGASVRIDVAAAAHGVRCWDATTSVDVMPGSLEGSVYYLH